MRSLSGLFVGVLTLALWLSPALSDPVVKNPVAVGQAIKEIVDKNFYQPVSFPTLETPSLSSATIDEALARLGASHTYRFQPDQIVYYEILDATKEGLVDPPVRHGRLGGLCGDRDDHANRWQQTLCDRHLRWRPSRQSRNEGRR